MKRVQTFLEMLAEVVSALTINVARLAAFSAALAFAMSWDFERAAGAVLGFSVLLVILAAALILIRKTWDVEPAVTVELWTPFGWEIGDGTLRIRFVRWAFVVVRLG